MDTENIIIDKFLTDGSYQFQQNAIIVSILFKIYNYVPIWQFTRVATFPTGNITGNSKASEAAPILSQEVGPGRGIGRGAVERGKHICKFYF